MLGGVRGSVIISLGVLTVGAECCAAAPVWGILTKTTDLPLFRVNFNHFRNLCLRGFHKIEILFSNSSTSKSSAQWWLCSVSVYPVVSPLGSDCYLPLWFALNGCQQPKSPSWPSLWKLHMIESHCISFPHVSAACATKFLGSKFPNVAMTYFIEREAGGIKSKNMKTVVSNSRSHLQLTNDNPHSIEYPVRIFVSLINFTSSLNYLIK